MGTRCNEPACNDMSHRELSILLSVLLEEEYPLSQVMYNKILSMLLPSASVVVSQSSQQRCDLFHYSNL